MTAKEIEKKYAHVINRGGKWDTDLQIGNQGFTICRDETYSKAKWYAKMLGIALKCLIDAETK